LQKKSKIASQTPSERRSILGYIESGLSAVQAEIKRPGFLQLAEIGHYDAKAGVCRMHHPRQSATPLSLHCVEVLKNAGLLPR
jgi:hypothetical protein